MVIGFMTTYAECIAFTPSVYMCIQFVPTESHTGSTGMSLAQPLPPQNANRSSARRFSAENAEDSESNWSIRPNLHETPEKEKLPQLPLPHSGLNLKSVLKITLVLVLAASYLTFCVIAHYRTIPIGGKGVMGLSFVHCEQRLC